MLDLCFIVGPDVFAGDTGSGYLEILGFSCVSFSGVVGLVDRSAGDWSFF